MKIPTNKREELIAKTEASALRPEAKERVLALLAKEELTEEEMGNILTTIQNDLEADFAELPDVNASLEQDEAYQARVAEHEAELAEIEKAAKESTEFITQETAALDALEADLTKAEEEVKLAAVKGNLGME